MKKKILIVLGITAAAVAIAAVSFSVGFKTGSLFPQNLIIHGVGNISEGQPGGVDFSTFWQAWQIINENYLNNKNVSDQNKVYGAISGLVNSLGDPYSIFLNPENNKRFQQDIQGNFGGIGAEIGIKNNQLLIIAPLKDTPSSRAGLKARDQILEINSSSTEGLSVEEAVKLIRGPEGSTVTLTIFREGFEKPKKFSVVRGNIVAPTLEYKMLDGNIADIQLESFNANADYLFYQAILKSFNAGAKGMILDLRDDPGGFLDTAVDIAGWFMPKGTLVVSEASVKGVTQELKANGNSALVNTPVVVLINEGSASASEILAGALRDDRGVKLVGEKSFGKGTVQQLLPLRDGSFLKLTIAHWVLPNGQILENGGISPDFEVKITDEDVKNNRDPQLDKAIEILKSEIK